MKHLATVQYNYYYNSIGATLGKENDYLTREFHQIPIDQTKELEKFKKLQELYLAKLQQAKQQFQIRRLIRAFLLPEEMETKTGPLTYEEKQAMKEKEQQKCNHPLIRDLKNININLVFDWLADHYTYIMHTSDGGVHIVQGIKKDRRYVMKDGTKSTHPFMIAQSSN